MARPGVAHRAVAAIGHNFVPHSDAERGRAASLSVDRVNAGAPGVTAVPRRPPALSAFEVPLRDRVLAKAVNSRTAGASGGVRYAFAIAVTLLALALKASIDPWTEKVSPFLFFTPAVMLSAWFGGFGPGLLSTCVGGVAADYFLLVPHHTFSHSAAEMTRLAVFTLVGVQISWLSGALHRANRELEARVRQRTSELAFQKSLLESQSEASPDGILAVSHDDDVIFFNRRFGAIWALTPAELAAPLPRLRGSMRQKVNGQSDVLATEASAGIAFGERSELIFLRDGRAVERFGAPIFARDGSSLGHVWFFRDVTERRRLEKEILEAGEREREKLGQDLHDDLCQQLTGIACLARVHRQRLEARAPDDAGDAATILQLVQQANNCARDLSKGLQPVMLEAKGLASALQELCSRVETACGTPCRFNGDDSAVAATDPAMVTHLYRIAQEAVNNAVKHARAKNIAVDLLGAGDRVILTVEDDGVGIPDAPARTGIGLHTMNHRARMIGGTLTVERGAAGGTTVTCSLRKTPLAEAGERDAEPIDSAAVAAGV